MNNPLAAVFAAFDRVMAKGQALAKLDFQGIPIVIDRPKGFVQESTGADGKQWRRVYLYDYGFIPGACGGDGEDLDVFIGPMPDAPDAYWATQTKDDGSFDEYKVFLGFASIQHAALAYEMHIPVTHLAAMTTMPVEQMKALLGQEPVAMIKAMKAMEEKTMTTKVKKDDELPEVPEANPADTGSGGADIVTIAAARLNSILESIDAGGGVLTGPLKQEITSVIALLETVAPDEDMDMDEPEAPEPPPEEAKAAGDKPPPPKADEEGAPVAKAARKMSPEGFVKFMSSEMVKAQAITNPTVKKARLAAIGKALEAGAAALVDTQVSGATTAFSSPNEGETIQIFVDPAYQGPEEVTAPTPATTIGQFAEDQTIAGQEAATGDIGQAAGSFGANGASAPAEAPLEKRWETLRLGLSSLLKGAGPAAVANPAAAQAAAVQSDLQKAQRGDDGWPTDMATEEFMAGTKKVAPMSFGHDNLPGKVQATGAGK